MAIEQITTSGPTITVSTLQELSDVYDELSHTPGGGTILVAPGYYDAFNPSVWNDTEIEETVIIKSADPSNPATFNSIYLENISNLRMENLSFDSNATGGHKNGDLHVRDSENIQIVSSTFIHDADDSRKLAGEILVAPGIGVTHSEKVLIEDNYIQGYRNGLGITSNKNVEVIGNEITRIQIDGIRGGGLQDVTISGNYLHDFVGVDYEVNHDDMIQIWGSNTDILTRNLTISDNIILSSTSMNQSIFIRNEAFGQEGNSTSGYFENITVSNNLIYNSHLNGLRVFDTDGLTIDGNTVLFNPDAVSTSTSGRSGQQIPVISAGNSKNVTLSNNISSEIWIRYEDEGTFINNQTVNFDDPNDPNYVLYHFENPFAGEDVQIDDLNILPESPWFGEVGSRIGNTPEDEPGGAEAIISATASISDRYEMTFDATASKGPDGESLSNAPGYTFKWTFADGSTATGAVVTKVVEEGGYTPATLEIEKDGETIVEQTRNVWVETKDIFAFDFENGVEELFGTNVEVAKAGPLVSSDGSQGMRIGDGAKLSISGDESVHAPFDIFGLALDLKPIGDEQNGIFLHQSGAMRASVTEDGRIGFELTTDQGSFQLTSDESVFDDGGTHRIGIAFNGYTGQLELFADGESIASTEAWGVVEANTKPIVFGNTWGDSIDAIIDNVEMSYDPSVAGDLPDAPVVNLPEEEPPFLETPPPVVEDTPPVTDIPTEEPIVAVPAPDPETVPLDVTLLLVDTQTDEVIKILEQNDTLPDDVLGAENISLVVETNQNIGSVEFTLGDFQAIENVSPYALFGDVGDDFKSPDDAPFEGAEQFRVGIDIFSEDNASGDLLASLNYNLFAEETSPDEEQVAEPVPPVSLAPPQVADDIFASPPPQQPEPAPQDPPAEPEPSLDLPGFMPMGRSQSMWENLNFGGSWFQGPPAEPEPSSDLPGFMPMGRSQSMWENLNFGGSWDDVLSDLGQSFTNGGSVDQDSGLFSQRSANNEQLSEMNMPAPRGAWLSEIIPVTGVLDETPPRPEAAEYLDEGLFMS